MNNGNDDFKKMDLNFDPTQEAKVDLEPKPTEQQTPVQPTVTPAPVEPKKEEQSSFGNNETKVDEDVLSALDKKEEPTPIIINESTLNTQPEPTPIKIESDSSQPMDKTLEFIIQNDPVKTDLTIDEKKEAKKAEKKAYKHKRISYLWILVALLSIVFGIDSIWRFAENISELISTFRNDEKGWFFDLLKVIVHSFEALLFVFFILFSMIKYKANHKPWIKWWDDTEPLRVAEEIKVQKKAYTKNIERINALSLYYTPVNKESHSDHELLSNLKAENKVLSDMISKEESRRKDEAKAKKK